MIKLKFLPARFGDSIWIEYGDNQETKRILIDGGTAGTRHRIKEMLEDLPVDERKFELMVVTHIDQDHIEGILTLLEQDDLGFEVRDFWFNGFKHLPVKDEDDDDDDESFGVKQGERLTTAIDKHNLSWNDDFNEKAVVVDSDTLPKIELPGGMRLTLLSPAPIHLEELGETWADEVEKANLAAGAITLLDEEEEEDEAFGVVDLPDIDVLSQSDFHEDDSEANGSSIAFLAEFDGKSMLFCGDAFPSQLVKTLNIVSPGDIIDLDIMKVSHHASSHNTSPELLAKINCKTYIISTNGSRFKHPKADTMSRLIKLGGPDVHLIFNYKTDRNEIWDTPTLKTDHNYTTTYPNDGEEGIEIEV